MIIEIIGLPFNEFEEIKDYIDSYIKDLINSTMINEVRESGVFILFYGFIEEDDYVNKLAVRKRECGNCSERLVRQILITISYYLKNQFYPDAEIMILDKE